MAQYTVRQGLTAKKGDIFYVGGETIELSAAEYIRYAHLLEESLRTVEPITALSTVNTVSNPVSGTATTAASDVMAASSNRVSYTLTNLSDLERLYLCFGTTATLANAQVILQPNATYTPDSLAQAKLRVSAIATGTSNYSYQEEVTSA